MKSGCLRKYRNQSCRVCKLRYEYRDRHWETKHSSREVYGINFGCPVSGEMAPAWQPYFRAAQCSAQLSALSVRCMPLTTAQDQQVRVRHSHRQFDYQHLFDL